MLTFGGPQIASIGYFLSKQALSGSSIGKDGKPGNRQAAYGVDTTEVRSVLKAAKAMLAYTVKKQRELKTVIDYLEGKITGNETIRSLVM